MKLLWEQFNLPAMKQLIAFLGLLCVAAPTLAQSTSTDLRGGTYSSVQSSARPRGLNIVDKVRVSGSDAASAAFNKDALPTLKSFANTNLREGNPMTNSDIHLNRIDPSKIKLNTATDVRAYFVGEGAGYHNTLGFNSKGGNTSTLGIDPKLIFPDASERASGVRTTSEPLKSGDFVNMGNFTANTQLNFFLMANAVNGGSSIYSTNHINPDKIVHAVAFTMPGTPYLLIGFEDLFGGGDRDYNDILFTLDIGVANVDHLSSPEPSAALILLGVAAVVLVRRRKTISGRVLA
jgi:hypothetical protein